MYHNVLAAGGQQFHLTFGWIYLIIAFLFGLLGMFWLKIPWWGIIIIYVLGILLPLVFPAVGAQISHFTGGKL